MSKLGTPDLKETRDQPFVAAARNSCADMCLDARVGPRVATSRRTEGWSQVPFRFWVSGHFTALKNAASATSFEFS